MNQSQPMRTAIWEMPSSDIATDGIYYESQCHGILERLNRLIQHTEDDETKLEILQMMDDHMKALLQFSIAPEVLEKQLDWNPDAKGELLPVTVNLLIHMLGSQWQETILEAGRMLALLAESDVSEVLGQLTDAIGKREQFFDRWVLNVLIGLSFRHTADIAPHLPNITAAFANREDLVVESLINRLHGRCGIDDDNEHEASAAQNEPSLAKPSVILPPKQQLSYELQPTAVDTVMQTAEQQIESYAKRLAEASELQWEYIQQEIHRQSEKCPTRHTYNLSERHGVLLQSEDDYGIAAGRAAMKFLQDRKVGVDKKQAMVQALRGVDPLLLTTLPGRFPQFVKKIEDGEDHEAWLNGAELQTYEPFREDGDWRVLGCCYQQATPHRFECLMSINCLVPRTLLEQVEISEVAERLFYYRRTFGLTLDEMTSDWWEYQSRARLGVLPLSMPIAGLVMTFQAMIGVAPTQVLKQYGIVPDPRNPLIWNIDDQKAVDFKYWGCGDCLDTMRDKEWQSEGQGWLIHKDALGKILQSTDGFELVRVFKIERIIRERTHQQFTGRQVTLWKVQSG